MECLEWEELQETFRAGREVGRDETVHLTHRMDGRVERNNTPSSTTPSWVFIEAWWWVSQALVKILNIQQQTPATIEHGGRKYDGV